ncbi:MULTISPECIES: LysR family transcriptional regulator [unclassified Variovorax]|jgi:DNA-binding transcriptional LysR family regulator|uniref:LysR family transcriptional regulator n=1 Tax=unclassified Variovorax TaxID=663243 RepID=UPI0008CEF6BD|nr:MULTISPECIES: LysR family transcriptional regulator [unclassified Variovorax]SEK12150.1 DNA-binding transcriptional regulator, LysR family [Variovorax sp. OK202]SFD79520.1 transcriptional regulator, LysR family [Variovorax sp. OK212]
MHVSDHALRCFLALAETGQFTAAAERCHLTQSALSQMISRLEERVGVRLFDRGNRSATLTDAGRRFVVSARRIALELDHALEDLRDVANLRTGHVSMAVVPSLAGTWLPGVLHDFRGQYPGVGVQLHDVSSVRCNELVQQGVVDIALNSLPGRPGELQARHLFDEPMYVVCALDHALAKRRSLSLQALRGARLLQLNGMSGMLVRTANGLEMAQQVLLKAGVVNTGLEVNNLSTLAGLVAAGFGVCLSPEASLPQFSLLPTVAVRLQSHSMVRPIYCTHRKSRELSPAAVAFCDILFSHPMPGQRH